jgi:tRNA(fMet)-specific endonuclease VapC
LSFIIDTMRREPAAIRKYEEFEGQDIPLSTIAITAMELYKGAYSSKDRMNVERVGIPGLFTPMPLDETVYEVFGRIAAGLSLTGNPIGDFDEAIAAMVLCSDGEIITRDRHFEKIPGLKVTGY